jgi:hypothetical protein
MQDAVPCRVEDLVEPAAGPGFDEKAMGVFAEAVRDPALFVRVRRLVDTEIESIRRRSSGRLSCASAGAVLAFIVGALVVGAFAPRKTAGFAGPALELLVDGLAARDAGSA